MAWGSKYIQSGFYIKSICSGNRKIKSISLTFDDGPDAQVTPMILDILKENNVKATFFIVGCKAQKHPELIKRMDKEGHIIAGHSYSHHILFDLLPANKMKQEMRQTEDVIFSITGKKICLFRPPYGVTNPPLAKAIRTMEYQSVGWSLKSNDTVIKDDTLILNNLTRRLRSGDIILFHDNKPWTVSVIKKFTDYLRKNEYSIERLDKLLNIQAYVN
jgi:peptidoglycan/xylan/chitin deacetylase (PgdA/CDA1 family)